MTWIEALILGLLQGLTEFLPVSSSGHLVIGKALLGIEMKEDLTFEIAVHAATVCSTLLVFRKDIWGLIQGLLKFQLNKETLYVGKLIFSAIPVILIGFFLADTVEGFFSGNLFLVGSMLLLTALLLAFTFYVKQKDKSISFIDALIIGVAQAIAVLPGLSRSGSTIATALLLKNKKDEAARFSFLMVIIPILGKVGLDMINGDLVSEKVNAMPLVVGFIAAFLTGLAACKLMISIVKRSKLIYFAIYCAIMAIATIIFSLLNS
jgi:undecaprenyl-diphosphatase